MTKLERKYLRSIWIHFNDKHNLGSVRTTEDLKAVLPDMKIYHQIVLEVLSMGDDQDDYELIEIFTENNIEIL